MWHCTLNILQLLVFSQLAVASQQLRHQRSCEEATARATLAADALRGHFWNETAGIWRELLWWQAANSLEVIAHHASIAGNTTLTSIVEADIENLYTQTNNMSRGGPFLTGYFDDEEWWALGWLEAWQLTGDSRYLSHFEIIFDHQVDMAWNESSCGGGGLDWQGFIYSENRFGVPYKGAITNELFLVMAGKMATEGPEHTRPQYREWAEREWEWFRGTGMINGEALVNDGLDKFDGHEQICANNNQTTWTYNQGVILGGLVHIWRLTGDEEVITTAAAIAKAAIVKLVHPAEAAGGVAGVMREPCEGNWMEYRQCSQDELQFKGVFFRYIVRWKLQQNWPEQIDRMNAGV
eukprot:SAG31_NODE_6948_length_1840_cov_1.426766_3_plen_351_part_00